MKRNSQNETCLFDCDMLDVSAHSSGNPLASIFVIVHLC